MHNNETNKYTGQQLVSSEDFPCDSFASVVGSAALFSVLSLLFVVLLCLTMAEEYKCLPVVIRQLCCHVHEFHLARNIVCSSAVLLNFIAAISNIVSVPFPRCSILVFS